MEESLKGFTEVVKSFWENVLGGNAVFMPQSHFVLQPKPPIPRATILPLPSWNLHWSHLTGLCYV